LNYVFGFGRSVLKGLKGWSVPLPLLFLLFLPFYTLPDAGQLIQEAHMQYFQLIAVLAFCFSMQKGRCSSYWNPFRWLVLFAMAQLLYFQVHPAMFFFIQMLIISYVFFEVCVRSEIGMNQLRVVLVFLLLVTFVYSVKQYFDVRGVPLLPEYLSVDKSGLSGTQLVSGIWIVQAYCGSFIAIIFPIVLMTKSRWKWLFLLMCVFVLINTHSSFAKAGVFAGATWVFWHKYHRWFLLYFSIAAVIFVFWYLGVDLGDASSEHHRFEVWRKTIEQAMEHPWIGYSLGSFYTFGYIKTYEIAQSNTFYAQAHNEALQLWFEMGATGILISIWFIFRTVWLGIRYRASDSMIALSGSMISAITVSMGQPIFHMVNISAIVITIFAMMESERNKLCSSDTTVQNL
jgi:O-antigen ligase